MEIEQDSQAPDLSEKGVVSAIVSILEHNGTVLLADLGGILGAALGPEASRVVKREFKGLKQLLERHKPLFQLTGKAPLLQVRLHKMPNSKTDATPLAKTSPAAPSASTQAKLSTTKSPSALVKQFVSDLATSVNKGAWKQTGKLLRVRCNAFSSAIGRAITVPKAHPNALPSDLQDIIESTLNMAEDIDWARVAVLHLLVCYHYIHSNYKAAVELQTKLMECFDAYWRGLASTREYNPRKTSPMDAWRVVLFEGRQLAVWADLSLESASQEGTLLLKFQNVLRPQSKLFERTPGLLLLQNTMLRIYTHTNTTSNFNTVLKVMDLQTIDATKYPTCDIVTWGFFMGRYHLYQGDYTKAVPLLAKAFSSCPSSYSRNKQLILTYLIPANAMVGKYPKSTLLDRYKLTEYSDLIEGIKRGNYKLYQDSMDKFERAFDRGVYLPLRRLTIILFRNLFKKTALIYFGTPEGMTPAKKNKLPFTAFNAALAISGYPTSPEEASCIVTNLIAQKKIRGYVSYEHQLIVLADGAAAFPTLNIK